MGFRECQGEATVSAHDLTQAKDPAAFLAHLEARVRLLVGKEVAKHAILSQERRSRDFGLVWDPETGACLSPAALIVHGTITVLPTDHARKVKAYCRGWEAWYESIPQEVRDKLSSPPDPLFLEISV